MPKKIIIGSRQSDLARIQAHVVADYICSKIPDLNVEFYHRPSMGDLNLDLDLQTTNSKGVFTQEFLEILKEGECDLVVHSWKDLPIETNNLTDIFTLSLREDQRDILFIKKDSFAKSNLKFLTSSPRREFHIKKSLKPLLPFKCDEFSFEPIRGNIPTRFLKFLNSDADGFVVAKAAVDRLMSTAKQKNQDEFLTIRKQIQDVFNQCHWMVLPLSIFPTAAAQGALAVEILKTSPFYNEIKELNDKSIYELVTLERQTHKNYGGGCHQSMGFSALKVHQGVVFYSSGTHNGSEFESIIFNADKKNIKKYKKDHVFLQNEIKFDREKSINNFKDLSQKIYNGYNEFIITRDEAKIVELKDSGQCLWVSGQKTWQKLAKQGYWVNGSLDGLGIDNKPNLNYLKPNGFYWLSHDEAPFEDIFGFDFISTYKVKPNLSEINVSDLKNKECFFWSSGHGFESILKIYPDLKNKMHFCGIGRTYKTLEKHIKPENLFVCLNESDFLNKVIQD